MERKTVIKLSGSMAQRFGRTHRRALTSASEVFRALSNTIDGFDAYLREARAKGMDFVIFRDRRNIGHEEFELLGPGDELRIIPVIRGSKRAGVFRALLGTALVAAAIWMPGSVSQRVTSCFPLGLQWLLAVWCKCSPLRYQACECGRTQITSLPMRLAAQSILQHPVTPFLCFTGRGR